MNVLLGAKLATTIKPDEVLVIKTHVIDVSRESDFNSRAIFISDLDFYLQLNIQNTPGLLCWQNPVLVW